MKELSYYAQGEVAKTGRKFATYVLDFITSMIIMLILFIFSEMIMNSAAMVKGYRDDIMTSYSSLIKEIEKTNISEADENEQLLDTDTLVSNYMKGSVYHSLKINGVEGISEDTYKDVKEITENNDHVYSYFVDFKTKHLSDYEEEGKTNCGWNYVSGELVKYSDSKYFALEENRYITIEKETAIAIDNYFRDTSYSIGREAYDSISSSYSLLLKAGIHDVQDYYQPYKRLFEGYQNHLKKFYRVRAVELLITYALSILIVYFVLPLIFRNGQTLSMKILKIGAVDKNGNQVSWYQLLLKSFINFIEYFLLVSITALCFYGTDALDLIGSTLFWNISYLSLGGFSIIFMFFSLLLTFCLRKTRQNIPEFLSGMIIKDSEVFAIEEEVHDNEEK